MQRGIRRSRRYRSQNCELGEKTREKLQVLRAGQRVGVFEMAAKSECAAKRTMPEARRGRAVEAVPAAPSRGGGAQPIGQHTANFSGINLQQQRRPCFKYDIRRNRVQRSRNL